MDRVALHDALRTLALASGVRFIYRNESLPAGRLITLDSTPRSVREQLTAMLRGTDLVAHRAAAGQYFILPKTAADTVSVSDDGVIVTASVQQLAAVPVQSTTVDSRTGPDLSMRTSPSATQVITGSVLERRGVRTLDELFHGDVPGVIAFDQGSDVNAIGTPALQVRGTMSFSTLNGALKTYVDGVEMADPTFINHIDARTIDRVELTLGPQASTIYGASAISGVMQIFTKHGVANGGWTPSVRATLSSGVISGRGRNTTLAPLHDHSVAIDGGTGNVAYHASTGYAFDGKHDGDGYSTASSRNAFAQFGTQLRTSAVDADVSGRINTRHFGASTDQFYALAIATGQVAYNPYRVVPYDRPGDVQQRVAGGSGTWRATSWMGQSLTVGVDEQATNVRAPAARRTVADSLSALSSGRGSRATGAWRTMLDTPIPALHDVRASTIVGVDTWVYNYRSLYQGLIPVTPDPTATQLPPNTLLDVHYSTRTWALGYFAQTTLAIRDALFITGGLRLGGDETGADSDHLLPRAGIAYVHAIGPMTVKWRGSFGKSERGCLSCRNGSAIPFAFIEANPLLRNETQRGGDVGVDVTMGGRASLQLTAYQQTSNGFLVETHSANATPPVFYKYQNGGDVRNRGLESNGTLRLGDFTLMGSYSLADGRIIAVTQPLPGNLHVGSTPLLVARNAGGASVGYSRARFHLTSGFSYVGPYETFNEALLSGILVGRTDNFSDPTTQVVRAPSDLRLYANASLRVTDHWSLFTRGDNLNNAYGMSLSRNVAGRRLTFGMQLSRP